MSLTSHLKDRTSPVQQYLHTRFPHTARLAAPVNAQLCTTPRLRPPGDVAGYPWGIIGHAVDYRLRYSFAITPSDQLVAYLGWVIYTAGEGEAVEAAKGFFDHLDALLARLQPAGRLLTPEDERELGRYCYVLGLFEAAYRSAREYGPLYEPPEKQTVEDLLAVVDAAWVEDICQMQGQFMEQHADLLTQPCVLNPTFGAGSLMIGGADADLIVDDCLLDIKTTTQSKVEPVWLRQLAGYALLDWEDVLRLRAAGLYLSRQGLLVRWPLDEYLGILAGDPTVTVAGLRQEFAGVVLQRKRKGTRIAVSRPAQRG